MVCSGAVERVKKIRDYAFVHFTQREDAVTAMNALNGKVRLIREHQHILTVRTETLRICNSL